MKRIVFGLTGIILSGGGQWYNSITYHRLVEESFSGKFPMDGYYIATVVWIVVGLLSLSFAVWGFYSKRVK